MIEPEELSRVGFGAYRVSVDSREHRSALVHALELGCTLIDTASNYMGGASERLIGSILAEFPRYDPFVITKAGYVQGKDLQLISDLTQRGLRSDAIVELESTTKYCIDPLFLDSQLEQASRRLGKATVDGFLLHNPEHHFNQSGSGMTPHEHYGRIEKAFAFFEENVDAGRLRFYGVSSNTFPHPTTEAGTTNLHELIKLARRLTSSHHFRFIEFPLNFLERGALLPHHGGQSLIAAARANGVVMLANRPFNAKSTAGPVRIATYETTAPSAAETAAVFDRAMTAIQRRLAEAEPKVSILDFPVLRYLSDHWPNLGTTDAVREVFLNHLLPLVETLGTPLDEESEGDRVACYDFFHCGLAWAAAEMNKQAIRLRRDLARSGLIKEADSRPLSKLACETYLSWGIDHVLAGMRQEVYVDALKSLFVPRGEFPPSPGTG